MQRSSDPSHDRLLRAVRVKEHYIEDHRKHIDQQVSADVTIQSLITLKKTNYISILMSGNLLI